MMPETKLIERIRGFAAATPLNGQLIAGIGDDCAVFRPNSRFDFVFTADFTLEGRHFTLETHSATDVGIKSLARSLSDLAAMGAEPVFCMLSLALPGGLSSAWLDEFYGGFTGAARNYKITLAGGDLARSEKVIVDVMCCGSVPFGETILRSGARPGDQIYVTGWLGYSALGFETQQGEAWLRHKQPIPRLAVGMKLRGLATSAMDLSDGLSLDLHRLCEESHVGADISSPIPMAEGATIAQALHGGEDYELLFTAPKGTDVPARIEDVAVTRIGVITNKSGSITYEGRALEPLGFDHFR